MAHTHGITVRLYKSDGKGMDVGNNKVSEGTADSTLHSSSQFFIGIFLKTKKYLVKDGENDAKGPRKKDDDCLPCVPRNPS